MKNQTLAKHSGRLPSAFNDFFKPWNELYEGGLWGKTMSIPAVNITEQKEGYEISLAAPGMKKNNFNIDVDGNLLTISSSMKEEKEEQEARFTRREYSYSSFERSFTLPEEVNKEKIEARYEEGILKLLLPKKEEAKKMAISKNIAVQ